MIKKYYCVAMRGRNPENPSERTKGIRTEQRLEINGGGGIKLFNNGAKRLHDIRG